MRVTSSSTAISAWVVWCFVGCTPKDDKPPSADAGDSGAIPTQTDAAPDAEVPLRPDTGVPDATVPTPDSGPITSVPVRVGLNSSTTLGVLADLDTISLGSNATTVAYDWVNGDDGAALDAALDRAELFASEGVRVLFTIDVVSGVRRQIPTLSPLPLDDVLLAVDQVLARKIPLHVLSIGSGLDVTLTLLGETDRERLGELVSGFLTYTIEHPDRFADTRVSFGTTTTGWSSPSSPLLEWLQLTQAVSLSWFAINSRGRATSSTAPGERLWPLLSTITSAGKPAYFQEVAYPSASAADSTEEKQERFFQNLFQDLVGRGDQIPFLTVRLYEPTEEECAAYVADYPMSAESAPQATADAELARCSVGLRGAGAPKRAFYPVFDAIALSRVP